MADEPEHLTAKGEDAVPCLVCKMPRKLCEGEAGGSSWLGRPTHVYFADKSQWQPKKYR